jgi:hypothetical protein
MPIKTKILSILIFIIHYNISFSQPKDTIYGKVKSIREQLLFLNDNIQNRKLFSTEGDYGHNGFMNEKYTINRFNIWWYDTYWVHYINYFKEFDSDNKVLKNIWYNKNQSIENAIENTYDLKGNITSQKLFSYVKSTTKHKYNKKNQLIYTRSVDSAGNFETAKYKYNSKNKIIKEKHYNSEYPKEFSKTTYYYDSFGNIIFLKKFNEHGEVSGTKYEYDAKNRKTKIIYHSPSVWVKTKIGNRQKRSKKGTDLIGWEYTYDNKNRIVDTRSYTSDYGVNRRIRKEIKKYDKDLLMGEYFYDTNDSIMTYRKYEYDSIGRIVKKENVFPKFPDSNTMINYYYDKNEYPIKLIYTENKVPIYVDFEYVFDDKKNWIQQTKSVNGKKLYVWQRGIKYFE